MEGRLLRGWPSTVSGCWLAPPESVEDVEAEETRRTERDDHAYDVSEAKGSGTTRA